LNTTEISLEKKIAKAKFDFGIVGFLCVVYRAAMKKDIIGVMIRTERKW